jgi:hypothetical protein
MQGNRQLNDPEARSQVAAGNCNCLDGLSAQLICQLPQLRFREPPYVLGAGDGIQ